MPLFRRGPWYWADLSIEGKRHRVPLKTDIGEEALDRLRKKRTELLAGKGITFADIVAKYKDWSRLQKPASVRTETLQLKWIE